MIGIVAALLLALSLCADCFAVSTCSSVTLREISWKKVLPIALAFAVVQSGLFVLGWEFGWLFVDYVTRIADIIGFLLLLYVGGFMILDAFKGSESPRDLNGIRNVVIGAFATSIDAFTVGISLSMGQDSEDDMFIKAGALFLVTFLSVALGMSGGRKIGKKYGKPAEITGGIVLIVIGLNILFDFL